MRWIVGLCLLMLVAACDVPTAGTSAPRGDFSPDVAARNFIQVVERV